MAGEITVGGIAVPLTHPGQVLFPGEGITRMPSPPSSARTSAGWRIYADVMRNAYAQTVVARLGSGREPWAAFAGSRPGLGAAGKRLARLER